MSMRLPLLASGLLLASVWADPAEEEAFLAVPGALCIGAGQRIYAATELPKTLVPLLDPEDGNIHEESSLTGFRAFLYDLNHDGSAEYFIYNRPGSGSGGSAYTIYTETDRGWQCLGGYRGGLLVLPAAKGWPRLVYFTRGGGNCYAKTHMEFRNGLYEDVLLELYDRGTITKKQLQEKKD